MRTALIVLAVVVVVVIVLAVLFAMWRRRRHDRYLQDRFGPEYDRVMAQADRDRDARSLLDERAEQHDQLTLRALAPETQRRYRERWTDVQARFVDQPATAVRDADALVIEVMEERGYPTDDFDERAGLVSVDHPEIVEDYRHAHDIARRERDGAASTDDLREAVRRYRSLFEALLSDGADDRSSASP